MKKLLKTGKKTLSVIMAIMMVLTAWVWVAPTQASAATAGSYYVRVNVRVYDGADHSGWGADGIPNEYTVDESTGKPGTADETNMAGFTLFYKENNGIGSEKWVTQDLKDALEKDEGEASNIESAVWAEDDENSTSYYLRKFAFEIEGFPTELYWMLDDNNALNETSYAISKITVASSSDAQEYVLWEGLCGGQSTREQKNGTINPDGATATKDDYARYETKGGNWEYPYAKTFDWSDKPEDMTCPKTGTESQTVAVVAKDQYGVTMFNPSWSVSATKDSDGLSVTTTKVEKATISLTNASNVAGTTNSQQATVTASWTGASGVAKTSSQKFTINDTTYEAIFTGHTDANGVVQEDVKGNYQHGMTPVEPSAYSYQDGDYDVTFTGWSPTVSAITSDTTYTAVYTRSDKILADYTAVNEAIAAADAIKANYGTEYEFKYTYASRMALDTAINAVVTGLGRTQQTTVDGYAQAINDSLSSLEPNKFDVIFLDGNGAILKYEKGVEYKTNVTPPSFPEEQKDYHDATNHYTYSGWDTDEYTSVIDDLVISPVYVAEAHDFVTETVSSTCVQAGTTKHTCQTCGYTYYDGGEELGDHQWEADFRVPYDIEPTCTTAGQKSIHCTLCDAQKDITVIPALDHQWGNVSSLSPASCDRDGINTRLCDDCGFCEHTIVPMTGHSYEKTTVAPTCTAKGYDEYICQNDGCGHSYRDNYTDTVAHTYGAWETVSYAHCGVSGVKKQTCTVENCGHVNIGPIDALEHDAIDSLSWNVIVAPTCEGKGYQTKTCSKCNNVIASEVTEAKGHSYTDEVVEPTCTTKGYTKRTCETCGDIVYTDEKAVLNHNWTSTRHEATCTSGAYITYTCQRDGCGETKVEVVDGSQAKAHDFDENIEANVTTTPATCVSDGSKTVKCANCDESKTTILPKLGHTWGAWEVTEAATNTTAGEMTRTCSNGTCTEIVEIPAGNHTWDNGKETLAPTCTIPGKMVYTCNNSEHKNCDVTIEVTIPVLQHTIAQREIEATCKTEGNVEAYCSACNTVLSTEVIPVKAHAYKAGTPVDATCTTSGYTPYTCDSCKGTYNVYDETKPATGHKLVEGTSTANCTTPGTKTLSCSVCKNYSVNVNVPALGHDYEKQGETVVATCTDPSIEVYKCKTCGNTYTKFIAVAKGHTWGDWKETQAATADNYGIKERTCSVCKAVEIAKIAPIGDHEFIEEITIPATCTTEGLKTFTCTVAEHGTCSANYTEEIPATGHKEALDYKAATCSEAGYARMVCSVESCKEVIKSETIPALGHLYGEGTVTNATCNTKGSIAYKCTRYGCTNENAVEIPENEKAHQYATTVTPATCYKEGSVVTKCALCDVVTTNEKLPMIKHAWNGGETTKAADCTNDGTMTYTCTVEGCGATKTEAIDKLGHDWGEWTVSKASTNTDKGEMKRSCNRTGCTAFETHTIPEGGHELKLNEEKSTPASCSVPGKAVYTCKNHADCGISVEVYLEKLQHELETTKTDATCIADGKVITKCKNCDTTTITTTIPATGHTYNDGEKTAATCTKEGKIVYTCQNGTCGHKKEVVLDKLQHVYAVESTTAPTCTANGYTTYKCSGCDSTYVIISATATGHNFDETVTANVTTVDATCTKDGTKTVKCKDCEAQDTVVIPKKGHNYIKGTVVNADCTTAGTEVYTCSCGDTYTKYIEPAKGHKWAENWTVVREATDDKNGVEKTTCTVCGEEKFRTTTPIGAHDFEETIVTPATCTTTGEKAFTCTVAEHGICSANYTEEIPATGHTEKLAYEAATCEADGSTKIVCDTCKNTISDVTTIPALGHLFDGEGTYVAATCVAEGSMTYTCGRDNCDVKHITKIAVNPEAHKLKRVVKNATCKEAGSITVTCENGCTYNETTTLPKLQHDLTDWVKKDSTNTQEGYWFHKCTKCDFEETLTIPAGGHTLTEIGRTNSTCTVAGSVTYECKVNHTGNVACGVKVVVALPLAGHTPVIEVVNTSCTTEGAVKTYCSVCKAKLADDIALGKIQHKFNVIETVDATCVKSGYKVYKCDNCNETYNEINGDAKGHTLKEGTSTATCLAGGKMTLNCACGYETTVDVPALGHDYDKASSTTATCAAAATETYTCSRVGCDASYTISVGTKTEEHKYPDTWSIVKEATSTSIGYKTRSCEICGQLEVVAIEATGEHKFENGEIVKTVDATCTENGYVERKCSVHTGENSCGKTAEITIPAKPHTEKAIEAVAATCTTAGSSAGSECSVCGTVLVAVVELPALGHAWGNEKVTPATCKTAGKIEYTCTRNCGEKHTVTIDIDENAHNLETTVLQASCTESGKVTVSCKNEGCTYSEVTATIPAKGHVWNENAASTQAATCENSGSETYKCKHCAAENIVIIPALGHVYEAGEKVAPTCTTSGYTVYTCKNDENHFYNVYDADATAVPHTWKVAEEKAADCTTNGFISYKCENCTATKSEIVPATGHDYAVTTTAETCTKTGTKTYTCDCGESYTEFVADAKGHKYGEWIVVTEATNAQDGQWKRVCEHDEDHVEYVTIPKGGHNLVEDEKQYVAPSCEEEGQQVYRCTAHENCTVTVTVTVPATGHDGKIVYNAPSCDTPGSSEIYCNTCKEIIATESIPAIGYHDFSGEGVVNKGDEATCDKDGKTTYTCTVDGCDAKITSVIPKTGHTLSTTVTEATCKAAGSVVTKCTVDGCDYNITKELAIKPHTLTLSTAYPGCEKEGYAATRCSVCGDEIHRETLAALGHSFTGEETVTKEATCLEKGEKTVKCSRCDETETVEIPATGHNYVAGKEVKATCTESGYIPYTCQNKDCTSSYRDLTSNPNGHKWNTTAVSEIKATCEKDGKATYKCQFCEATNEVITPKFGHSWTEWTISKAPTATEEGEKTRTCLRGCKETVSIPALGGVTTYKVDFVVDGEIIFTQTVSHLGSATAPVVADKAPDAKYHYSLVWDTDFSVVISDLTVTAVFTPVSHTYGEWVIDKAADCKNAGLRHRVCDCGYVQEETVPATEHDFSEIKEEKAPTCNDDGYKVVVCKNCGTTKTQTVNKLGHAMTYYQGYDATCDTDGVARHYSCSRCGKNFEDRAGKKEITSIVVVKKYHTYIVVPGTAPTCTDEGVTDYRYCTACGYTQHPEAIPATGHADINHDNTCDKCGATYMQGGNIICSCSCHKNGFFNELIYKILSFFWRLFGSNKSCECGKVHY